MDQAILIAAVPAFVASVVEWVEAFTIVLAVGNTRGWRSPIWGTVGGLATLTVIVAVFGTPLVIYQEEVKQSFHIVVGILLLLFGMRWLRKSLLRFAGIIALHDEEVIYQREVAELRAAGLKSNRWDNIGFWFSYKAVLLEGLERAFIVLALGAQGGGALQPPIAGALAAFVVVLIAGSLLHKPLAFVPENFMKWVVGAMLTTVGIFWGRRRFPGRVAARRRHAAHHPRRRVSDQLCRRAHAGADRPAGCARRRAQH